jgi:ABC-2 type transport system permease protein
MSTTLDDASMPPASTASLPVPAAAPAATAVPALLAERPMAGGVGLLRYRPWRGQFQGPWRAVLAIARTGLAQLLRRKLFWGLYALSLLVFFLFFYGQYGLVWLQGQVQNQPTAISPGVGAPKVQTGDLIRRLNDRWNLNGTGKTFRNFIWFEGQMVMIVLALAGAVLVGNDFRFGTLPFYLSKPMSKWHYLLGKCLAVAFFVNLLTTLPAAILWVQYGLITEWSYFYEQLGLLLGIVGYGLVLTVTFSLLLVATAVWLQRTAPLIMIWVAIFMLGPVLVSILVDGLKFSEYWRLLDLWNNTYLVGSRCLGIEEPLWRSAALTLAVLSAGCLAYLSRRIRAVEVVS